MTDIAAWFHAHRRTLGAPALEISDAVGAGRIRPIAFYLPQYHPIPENDAWWGKGFTEWTNVVRATPQFVGHYQPHLAAELGVYDLRVPETRAAQAELAREHGIFGFCYYHYWFAGRRLLERPFQEVVRSKEPDFPFCLCWANENWSRRWDGSDHQILVAQQHSPEDDKALIEALFEAFEDPRYIRVDGKPLFLVYRPMLLPNPRATAAIWREACAEAGIGDLYLCNVHSFDTVSPQAIGFDAAVEFPPNLKPMRRLNGQVSMLVPEFHGDIFEYEVFAEAPAPGYPYFRGIFPEWDNTPRRKATATVIVGSTPEKYADWLANICAYTQKHLPPDRRFVFINAWNEWGEGCHLEPDERSGRAYLEKTRDVLGAFNAPDAARTSH
jgi:lipopolysaccharide biosynthesis protein